MGRAEDDARNNIAEVITLILKNNIHGRVWDRFARTGELVVNRDDLVMGTVQLLERASAIASSIQSLWYSERRDQPKDTPDTYGLGDKGS